MRPVNTDRAAVRAACLEKAQLLRLFFADGADRGGKTLRFTGVRIAARAGAWLKRIVYVVPFTTIIEQNAGEFRKVMSRIEGIPTDRLVIEHHSNFDPDKELDTRGWPVKTGMHLDCDHVGSVL